jgi:hypothetical protein
VDVDVDTNIAQRRLPSSAHTSSLLALISYIALAVLFFGRGVVSAPNDRVVGDAGSDKTIFMWALEWWPRALADAKDPLNADVVWAPNGMDLSWVAAIPGAAYVATPLTSIVGPVTSYNVLALLAPATAAWTAFFLGRWVTSSFWPGFVCGLLFGFSSYEIGHTIGHLNLTLVAVIPLAVLLVLRRATEELSARRYIAYLTIVLSAQFLVSTETFLTLLGVGVLALAFGWWILERQRRSAVHKTAIDTFLSLVLTAIVVCPYLIHAFVLTGPAWAPTRDPFDAAADIANFAVPRRWTWLRPPGGDELARRFTANPVESTAYLGVPLIAIVVLFAARRGRPRAHVLLLALLGTTILFSLGPWVRIAGTTIAVGPGYALAHLPVTRNALPVRLTLFVALFAGLVCAIWLAERPQSRLRWLAGCAAVIALLPTWSTSFWSADVERSTFFSDRHAKRTFDGDDTVLVLPYGRSGWSMLWQAESDFAYRMAGGRLGNLPPDEQRWLPVLRSLAGAEVTPQARRMFRRFLEEHRVDAIVIAPGTRRPQRKMITALGLVPRRIADALVYTLRPQSMVTPMR